MDPCPYVRVIVESLALKLPPVARSAGPEVHPSAAPCFCTVQLQDCASSSPKTVPVPLVADPTSTTRLTDAPSSSSSSPVVISLEPAAWRRLSGKRASLTLSVYSGQSGSTCGFGSSRQVGRVRVAVDLGSAAERAAVVQSGWVSMGSGRAAARLHLVVRVEPDPRFVFQFEGEPECSPVVYQIQGSGGGGTGHSRCLRQPVFSCSFGVDRRLRSTRPRPLPTAKTSLTRCWSLRTEAENERREQRKGWTVTIHDLSGSPVAAASIVTPFVPSPGSDRVSRSNPGKWLILRTMGRSTTNWKPWGRLEAWREWGPVDALGFRFELVSDAATGSSNSSSNSGGVCIAATSLSVRRGGQFCIDSSAAEDVMPAGSSWPFGAGFVMAASVAGHGKVSKPTVQVGAQHVTCMAHAALFVALSAAIDLSMDACQLFSQKLRKELCPDSKEHSV